MSALSIEVPFPVFQDRDGQPLENGYIWLGVANLNPQVNPVIAYFDEALTIPAAQPLRTINGYISNAGTPAQVYVDAVNFSILVQDSKGSMVYNFPDGTGISPDACGVIYNPPFTGGVAYPLCEKLEQTVSVKDFGAVGDGVTDDTAAIQAAINAVADEAIILLPPGNYLVTSVTSTKNIMWMASSAQLNGQRVSKLSMTNNLPTLYSRLAIISNPSSIVAGETAGIKVIVGPNDIATPGANDFIAGTFFTSSSPTRGGLWGINVLALQDPSGLDGIVRAAEFEVNNTEGFNADPWSGLFPARKNGIEIVGHNSSLFRTTAAIMTWANDDTGVKWWDTGVAISRAFSNGILFKKNPGSSIDAVEPFQFAAIRDESNSARVISVAGSHAIFADLSFATAIGVFVKGFTSQNTILGFRNFVDYNMTLQINAGDTASQAALISFTDRTTDMWTIGKLSDNRFDINYQGSSVMILNGSNSNPISIMVAGTVKNVIQAAPDSGGTGFRTLVVAN